MANVESSPSLARRSSLASADGGFSRSTEIAQGVSQLPHVRGRMHSLPHDVADHEAESAVAQLDGVEPVSADVQTLRAGEITRGDLHPQPAAA